MNAFEFSEGIKYLDMSFKEIACTSKRLSKNIYEYKSNLFLS